MPARPVRARGVSAIRQSRRTCRRCLLVFLPFIAWQAAPAGAQYSRPSGGHSLDRLPIEVERQIRMELRADEPAWDDVLRLFFGADGYDQGVPDLVVYIPAIGSAKQALVHRGALVRDLVGQENLYIVVFSERPLPRLLAGPHLAFSVRSLETEEDPFLTALVKALAGQLTTSVPEPELEEGEDAAVALTLRDVRADTTSGDPLWVAMGRVRLGPNSLNRVTIAPHEGVSLDPHLSLHNMFANSAASAFGMSLGAGFTMNAGRPRFEDGEEIGTDSDLRSSLYLFGHVYLDRPHLPVDRFSLAVAFGTNLLGGDLLDDLVVGVSVGRFAGLGVIVGANSLEWPILEESTSQVRESRRWRAFVALDFGL